MESEGDKPSIYFIDTNSLIQCARRFDDLLRFGPIWQRLADLVSAERLLAPEQVVDEASKMSPLLKQWTASLDGFSASTADLWADAHAITNRFPYLVDDAVPGRAGDPWLLALAVKHERSRGLFDPHCIVVSEETVRRRAVRITRIPEVCAQLNLVCVNVWGMIDREGWKVGFIE